QLVAVDLLVAPRDPAHLRPRLVQVPGCLCHPSPVDLHALFTDSPHAPTHCSRRSYDRGEGGCDTLGHSRLNDPARGFRIPLTGRAPAPARPAAGPNG